MRAIRGPIDVMGYSALMVPYGRGGAVEYRAAWRAPSMPAKWGASLSTDGLRIPLRPIANVDCPVRVDLDQQIDQTVLLLGSVQGKFEQPNLLLAVNGGNDCGFQRKAASDSDLIAATLPI